MSDWKAACHEGLPIVPANVNKMRTPDLSKTLRVEEGMEPVGLTPYTPLTLPGIAVTLYSYLEEEEVQRQRRLARSV
jgi:hypothetical protein